eukprot:1462203-Prorocentrum_lima.AAC.1
MTSSLVGSEMCIRDSRFPENLDDERKKVHEQFYLSAQKLEPEQLNDILPCLLYTSDAADDM